MTAYEKPIVDTKRIESIILKHFGPGAAEITPLAGGNLSSVFTFIHEGQHYVVKFSDLEGAYETERYISTLLAGKGIPYPRCFALGKSDRLAYLILEKMNGRNLADFTAEEQLRLLPKLIGILTKLAVVDTSATSGYGWIGSDGNGAYDSWKEFVVAFNSEDQTGTFWENWYDLFRTSCLEKNVFEEIYNRMLDFVPYNEPYRGFVHGDFHQWNILSDGTRITGIIDGNYLYGDPLVDLAILDRHMPSSGVIQAYQDHLANLGVSIPFFKERLLGAYYYKGLDGLRFYAKMGWSDAYKGTRQFLLNLRA